MDIHGFFHPKYIPWLAHLKEIREIRITTLGWYNCLSVMGDNDFKNLNLFDVISTLVETKKNSLEFFLLFLGPDKALYFNVREIPSGLQLLTEETNPRVSEMARKEGVSFAEF